MSEVPIRQGGRLLRFTGDVAFDSPSGAAGVVCGGDGNGRHYWRHAKTEQRYEEWRTAQIGGGSAA